MAIGKGSMARAAKAPVKKETAPEVKTKTPAKKAPAAPKAAAITPTKQVMDMATKDRIEIGDEMPIYFL